MTQVSGEQQNRGVGGAVGRAAGRVRGGDQPQSCPRTDILSPMESGGSVLSGVIDSAVQATKWFFQSGCQIRTN
jgi:hypothetical protein